MRDEANGTEARKSLLGLLATAPEGRAVELFEALAFSPAFEMLRAPEFGSVMLRGRAGGTGAPFNLGEVTVTRCSLRLKSGEVGHGYVQGRRKADARITALIDALMQTGAAVLIEAQVLVPLRAEREARRDTRAAKAAATKVEFFTMVRGEDT